MWVKERDVTQKKRSNSLFIEDHSICLSISGWVGGVCSLQLSLEIIYRHPKLQHDGRVFLFRKLHMANKKGGSYRYIKLLHRTHGNHARQSNLIYNTCMYMYFLQLHKGHATQSNSRVTCLEGWLLSHPLWLAEQNQSYSHKKGRNTHKNHRHGGWKPPQQCAEQYYSSMMISQLANKRVVTIDRLQILDHYAVHSTHNTITNELMKWHYPIGSISDSHWQHSVRFSSQKGW